MCCTDTGSGQGQLLARKAKPITRYTEIQRCRSPMSIVTSVPTRTMLFLIYRCIGAWHRQVCGLVPFIVPDIFRFISPHTAEDQTGITLAYLCFVYYTRTASGIHSLQVIPFSLNSATKAIHCKTRVNGSALTQPIPTRLQVKRSHGQVRSRYIGRIRIVIRQVAVYNRIPLVAGKRTNGVERCSIRSQHAY